MTAERSTAGAAPARFLALGDSYTIGEGVAPEARWPVVLANRLRSAGARVEDPLIVARTGWTTDELIDAFDARPPQGAFALVSLLIGVNDQYRGRSAAAYGTAFEAMLARAIGRAGGQAGHVIVVSIPDWGVTPFAAGRDRRRIAREIDAFNAVNAAAARSAGTRYVDITGLSRDAAAGADPTAADGLHPSAVSYARWVERVLPVARSVVLPTVAAGET